MANIDHLYNDPDWMLQAGLADIEFEQDMYDDIVYGKPAEQPDWKREALLDEMMMENFEPLADYDELALMGLRKHAMEGPMRYLYNEKMKEGRKAGYLGQASWDDLRPDRAPSQIDLNLDQIIYGMYPGKSGMEGIGKWDPAKGSLQDYISDIYRHEYKHPLFSKYIQPLPGKDERHSELREHNLKKKYDKIRRQYRSNDPQHALIHATGALYDKSGQMSDFDFRNLNQVTPEGKQFSGKLLDYGKQLHRGLNTHPGSAPPSRAQQRLNTGGIVSLMI